MVFYTSSWWFFFYIDKNLFALAASALELQRNTASSSAMIGRNMNEYAYASLHFFPYIYLLLIHQTCKKMKILKRNIFQLFHLCLSFSFLFFFWDVWGIRVFSCICVNTVWNSNSHMVDAIRMQIEVQRRLHEQLEVNTQLITFAKSPKNIKLYLYYKKIN